MGFGDASKKDKAAAKAAGAAATAEAAKEDAEWSEGGKKANKKKDADEAKKEAKQARKAEADEQLKQEEAEVSTPRGGKDKKKGNASAGKLTRAEIAAKALAATKAKEKEDKQRKIDIAKSGGNDYIGVLMENDNRSKEIDASGVDAAIDALSVADSSGGGSTSKVNKKAAYAAFEEREIARLKEENAGLKLSQYKEQVHKLWQKSPENPDNQAVELS